MISISRLLCGTISPGDSLRYGDRPTHSSSIALPDENNPRPVVVWNCTRQCNLNCIHCYANAGNEKDPGEMDTEAGKSLIRDLADFKVPVLMFSGGEPLLRKDLFELISYAREQGLRIVLSTNGTAITEAVAQEISRNGLAEVGISLDGIGDNNDTFRGKKGAYVAALQGIRNCKAVGLRVSLRLTITRSNYQEIPAIFQLVEDEGIDRLCFYHLAYSGRGGSLQKEDITHSQTRAVVETICQHTVDLHNRGFSKEVLTVANHADAVYIYLRLKEQDPQRAEIVLKLLRGNGGNNSGIKIGSIDDRGNVHPDQFWWHHSLGNCQQKKFGDIWMDTSQPLLRGLKNRRGLLKGRCAHCQYLDLCNGNLRVRAEVVHGDIWAEDPACYLSDEEIGLAK